MDAPRQEYQDFLELVNLGDGTLRDAIWGHLFPDDVNTRDPVVYEYKVRISSWFTFSMSILGLPIDFGFVTSFLRRRRDHRY